MARQNLSSLNANLSPVTRDGRGIVSVFQIPHSLTIGMRANVPGYLQLCSQAYTDNNWTRSCMYFLSPNVRELASECLLAAALLICTAAGSELRRT
jgi:hypothetical protein